jgi:hypothetical protein
MGDTRHRCCTDAAQHSSLAAHQGPLAWRILLARIGRTKAGIPGGAMVSPDHRSPARLTAPGSPESGEFESGRHGGWLELGIVARFCLGGWHVADRLEAAAGVVPVHPLEGGVLDRFQRAPRAAVSNHLGLEQADDGLREPASRSRSVYRMGTYCPPLSL